jgi:hypothetical protein
MMTNDDLHDRQALDKQAEHRHRYFFRTRVVDIPRGWT